MNAIVEAPVFNAQIAITEESLRLARQCESTVELAKSFVIDSQEMAEEAMAEIRLIRQRTERLGAMRDGFIAPAEQIMEHAKALFTPGINALKEGERLLKGQLATWEEVKRKRIAEQKRIAAEAEAALRRAAEEEAAATRAQAAAEAAEKRRQAEEARQRAAQDTAAAAEAARLEAEANSVEEQAEEQAQNIALEAAAAAPVAVIEETRTKGFHTRDKWEGKVENLSLAILAIAMEEQYHNLLKIDQSALNKLAAATNGAVKIDGIKFVCEKISVARAA